jgi:hypothetical protein
MNRRQCLDAAAEAVLKDRQATYGPPEDSFGDAAKVWSVILGFGVEDWQVALCLAGLKLVRAKASPKHADNWADLCGYGSCGAELATAPEQTEMQFGGVTPFETVKRVAARDLQAYVGPLPDWVLAQLAIVKGMTEPEAETEVECAHAPQWVAGAWICTKCGKDVMQ